MEVPINGGLLYHEMQESKLCAVHCVNTVLQGPFFSEFDLAALASDLDRRERQMMLQGVDGGLSGDFLSEDSHNVSMGGDFSIQVGFLLGFSLLDFAIRSSKVKLRLVSAIHHRAYASLEELLSKKKFPLMIFAS